MKHIRITARLLFTIITLALTFLFAFTLSDAAANSAKSAVQAPPVDTRKLISSVDVTGATVEIEYMRDKSTHVYRLDYLTAIMVNNNKAQMGQIKVGMKVVDFIERDAHTLDSISLEGNSTAPVAPAAPVPRAPKKR